MGSLSSLLITNIVIWTIVIIFILTAGSFFAGFWGWIKLGGSDELHDSSMRILMKVLIVEIVIAFTGLGAVYVANVLPKYLEQTKGPSKGTMTTEYGKVIIDLNRLAPVTLQRMSSGLDAMFNPHNAETDEKSFWNRHGIGLLVKITNPGQELVIELREINELNEYGDLVNDLDLQNFVMRQISVLHIHRNDQEYRGEFAKYFLSEFPGPEAEHLLTRVPQGELALPSASISEILGGHYMLDWEATVAAFGRLRCEEGDQNSCSVYGDFAHPTPTTLLPR